MVGRKTYVSSSSQHKEANHDKDHVESEASNTANTPASNPTIPVISLPHPKVGSSPEDEAEEGVEKRAHQRE